MKEVERTVTSVAFTTEEAKHIKAIANIECGSILCYACPLNIPDEPCIRQRLQTLVDSDKLEVYDE